MMIDRAFAHEREKEVFIQDALAEPNLGGLTHCRWNVCFLMPQDVMTSPPVSGTLTEQFGTCGRAWRPNEGQCLPSNAEIFPKKGQRLPQRG
jgi:hypothetical protein